MKRIYVVSIGWNTSRQIPERTYLRSTGLGKIASNLLKVFKLTGLGNIGIAYAHVSTAKILIKVLEKLERSVCNVCMPIIQYSIKTYRERLILFLHSCIIDRTVIDSFSLTHLNLVFNFGGFIGLFFYWAMFEFILCYLQLQIRIFSVTVA